MKGRSHNLLFLFVVLIFSGIGSMAIVQGLLITGARADSANITNQKDIRQPFGTDPLGANIYVVNLHDNTLSIISGQTTTVIGNATIVDKYPSLFTLNSPSGGNTYLVNLHHGTLSIISGQTTTVIGNPIFVKHSAGKTTLGLSSTKPYKIATALKVPLSSAAPKVSSKVAVKTSHAGTSSAVVITNSGSKAVSTPSHPPLIP